MLFTTKLVIQEINFRPFYYINISLLVLINGIFFKKETLYLCVTSLYYFLNVLKLLFYYKMHCFFEISYILQLSHPQQGDVNGLQNIKLKTLTYLLLSFYSVILKGIHNMLYGVTAIRQYRCLTTSKCERGKVKGKQ